MTERTQNADFRRKPQIFADSPLLLEIPAFGGHGKPQKTADFRRKPKIFVENRRKPQIGLRHLRSVTFSSALCSNGAVQTRVGLELAELSRVSPKLESQDQLRVKTLPSKSLAVWVERCEPLSSQASGT